MKSIIFTNINGLSDIYPPQPASKALPEWYKKTHSYTTIEKKPTDDGNTSATVKRCMPFFDAMNAGYIIFSQVDVYVKIKDGFHWFSWPDLEPIQFHSEKQISEYPNKTNGDIPKWINSWVIKTPKGYSSLFVTPFHHELPFSIMSGIVDSDAYNAPVNFPFIIKDNSWEGMIPAGTPIAQVIPFKRDNFEMHFGGEDEIERYEQIKKRARLNFFDFYKNKYWQRKIYK